MKKPNKNIKPINPIILGGTNEDLSINWGVFTRCLYLTYKAQQYQFRKKRKEK